MDRRTHQKSRKYGSLEAISLPIELSFERKLKCYWRRYVFLRLSGETFYHLLPFDVLMFRLAICVSSIHLSFKDTNCEIIGARESVTLLWSFRWNSFAMAKSATSLHFRKVQPAWQLIESEVVKSINLCFLKKHG